MMINIDNQALINAELIDPVLRAKYGADIIGVSSGGYGTIVHVVDSANLSIQGGISDLLTQWDNLAVNASKTQIIANGVDETVITCGALGNDFDYTVINPAGGTVSGAVNDGTLELSGYYIGVYTVIIYSGSQSGIITIEGV